MSEIEDPHNDTDTVSIKLVLSGDTGAYTSLVQAHMPKVFALLLRLTGDKEVAQELSHEAFIKAYENLKSFKGTAKFSTWLTRIALNHANNYFSSRRYKEHVRSEPFDVERHEMSSTPQEQESELREMRLAAFRRSLALLDAKYREVIVLCSLEGKSYEEAAEALEIPIGTIRSRLNKARLLLKDSITNHIETR